MKTLHGSVGLRLAGAGSMLVALMGAVGCGAPAMPGGDGSNLLDDTAVGKAQCGDAATKQLKPFLVNMDATDLASLEARASRDIIFVRYEGCELTVIEACNDGGIPAKYGKYRAPEFTSGTREGIAMRDQNELYANLPLGAVEFGGAVSQDQQLNLNYFVAGTVTSTRDQVTRADIADNAACESATHFVWAYHLGAFDLASSAKTDGSVNASYAGMGAGMESSTENKSLKHGGKLESCDTHTQSECRVPIRVVLREISDAAPTTAPVAGAPAIAPPADAPPGWAESPQGQAFALIDSASKKEAGGDGKACLEDLDRAEKIHPPSRKDQRVNYIRAQCEMRVGKCDEGKARLREYLLNLEQHKNTSESDIDKMVDASAMKCPSSSGTLDERVNRAYMRIGEAMAKNDPHACMEEAKRMTPILSTIPKGTSTIAVRSKATSVLTMASQCVGKAGKCEDGWKLQQQYYNEQHAGQMPMGELMDAAKAAYDAMVPDCKGKY